MKRWLSRSSLVVIVLSCGASAAAQAPAKPPSAGNSQTRAKAPAPGEVEVDPIKCWWKTDKSAVQVGQRFTLTLTCGAIETSRIKVVPDLNQLEPTTVAIAPFEVVGGARHEDIVAPPWRYSQFEYAVRLLGDSFFGKDVNVPAVKITYHVQSTVGGGNQGRDQTYAMPVLPMRIESLVPQRAADIRDASHDTFAAIEARRFRATSELVAALIGFGFAVVLLGLAGVRAFGRFRVRTPAAAPRLPLGAVLRACLSALRRVKAEVESGGWTPELAGRALTVLRVASAIALNRTVAQVVVAADVPGRDGQLVLDRGILRRRRVLVSTPMTPGGIARALGGANGSTPDARTQATLAELQESMRAFSAARYSRNGHLDRTSLDAALENGEGAVRRLRVTHLWPMRTAGALAKSAHEIGEAVWSR